MKEVPNQKNIVHGNITAGGSVHIGDYLVTYIIETKEVKIPHRLTNYIPTNADYVLGRETELETITKYLAIKKPTVLVNGIGGIGKTSVAIKYMALRSGEYKHLAWLTVQSSILETFIGNSALLESLKITEKVQELILGQQLASAFELVFHKLNILEKTLVVLDNANDLEDLEKYEHLFDTAACHFLITSRTYPTQWTIVPIDALPEDEALELFKKIHPSVQASDKAIKNLLSKLFYHTLLIELVAKAIESSAYLFEELQEIIEKQFIHHEALNEDVISTGKHGGVVKDNLKKSKIENYIWLIFSQVKGLDARSKNILMSIALLPLAMMVERNQLKEHLNIFDLREPMPTLVLLVERGWVDRIKGIEQKTYFKMHPLIADVVVEHLEVNVSYAYKYIEFVTKVIDYDNVNPDHDLFEKNKKKPLAERLNYLFAQDNTEGIAELLDRLAQLEKQFGFYNKAMIYRSKALSIALNIFSAGNEKIASYQVNLALVYRDLGYYDKAVELLEMALASNLKNFNDSHPEVSKTQSNLALSYYELKDYKRAADLLEKALESDLKTYGTNHPIVSTRQNNLGITYRELGQYELAVDLLESALKNYIHNFGKNHPGVAKKQSNLAAVYFSLGQNERAALLTESALDTDISNFGHEHPSIAIRQNNLAWIYKKMGRDLDAKLLWQTAYTIYLKNLGPNHRDTILFKERSEM
jgi:tetratricopeptide (TPR) repeat protein